METSDTETGKPVFSDKPSNTMLITLSDCLRNGKFARLFHISRTYLRRRLVGDIPDNVVIEVINKCNLACPLCTLPQGSLKRKREEMSFQNFEHIVRELKNHAQGIVMQFAGETLLHKDIVKMISHASKNGLLITMDTNATLLTPTLAEGLIESGLDTIVVGLDGATKDSYEKWRVNAKFEDTLRNITTLCDFKKKKRKKTPIVEIQCIANRYNQDELPEVKRMSREIGADRFRVMSLAIPSHIYDETTCQEMAKEFLPTRPDVKSRYHRPRPSLCHYWAMNTAILVDGTVTMCCYDLNGEYSFGNIFKEGFLSIWNSEKYRYYRKNLIINKKLPLCARCPHM